MRAKKCPERLPNLHLRHAAGRTTTTLFMVRLCGLAEQITRSPTVSRQPRGRVGLALEFSGNLLGSRYACRSSATISSMAICSPGKCFPYARSQLMAIERAASLRPMAPSDAVPRQSSHSWCPKR